MRKKPLAAIFALFAIFSILIVSSPNEAHADAGFQQWIRNFKSVAAKSGVNGSTYDAVFAGITTPDPEVMKSAKYQPEFVSQVWDYLDSRVNSHSIEKGQEMAKKYKSWLDKIEAKYGVDRYVLLGIWSMETSYGNVLEREGVLKSVARSLATLAYADKKRAKYARSQLIAAMKIVQSGDVSAKGLQGSWAGAMGHTQFIPTSYLAWAQDIDGDGHRNVWSSVPDALASSANLLKKNGWRRGETWGYEVVLPRGFNYDLVNKDGLTIGTFQKNGVVRANGKAFPRSSDKAVLKMLGGKDGPAFLMTRNFYVIKRYNNSDKYAMAVGHLADRIRGGGPIIQDWPRGYKPLDEEERKELQISLKKHGFYDGEIDGNIGSGSRSAIKDFQIKAGMTPDGYPSKSVLKRLREG